MPRHVSCAHAVWSGRGSEAESPGICRAHACVPRLGGRVAFPRNRGRTNSVWALEQRRPLQPRRLPSPHLPCHASSRARPAPARRDGVSPVPPGDALMWGEATHSCGACACLCGCCPRRASSRLLTASLPASRPPPPSTSLASSLSLPCACRKRVFTCANSVRDTEYVCVCGGRGMQRNAMQGQSCTPSPSGATTW